MTLLENINIIDVLNEQCIYNSNILFDKDIIKDIGVKNVPSNITIIDCKNSFALPSFIDLHAHITFDGRGHNHIPYFEYSENDELSFLRASQNLIEALLSGICLIRDVGSKSSKSLNLKKIVDSGKILGPELVLCGEPFCASSGHGIDFGIEYENIDNLNNYLKLHKIKGYDWIKIMNGPELVEFEKLKEIVFIAHENNLKVAIHAFTNEGITNAIKSRADTIEHSLIVNNETLVCAKNNNTYFVPTFFCAWLSLKEEFIKVLPLKEIEYLQQWYSLLNDNFNYHIKNNISIAVGTDAGSAPCTFSDLIDEILMFCYFGLKNIDSIASATIIPARILGKENLFGSINIGKYANILIVKNNTLENINQLTNLNAIFYKGVSIKNNYQKPWN